MWDSTQEYQPPQEKAQGDGVQGYRVGSIVICETRNGKRQYGFKAPDDKWPKVKVWSREGMINLAPFINIFYSPDKHFADTVAVDTEYPISFYLTHTDDQYPKPIKAEFNQESRGAMASYIMGLADNKGVKLSDGPYTDEWFTSAVATLRGK